MSESPDTVPHLVISEDFYSIQGEGITSGHPSYFIRLKDCNLTCGASRQAAKAIKDGGIGSVKPGTFQGDLHTSGQATWTCDTLPVWIFGEKKPFNYLTDKWEKQINYDGSTLLSKILQGSVHLVWTGGEPALPRNQNSIVSFLDTFLLKYVNNGYEHVYNELETNGTQVLTEEMLSWMAQINCSAKLSNSGMSKQMRIVPAAIESIRDHWNSWFKFVISSEADVNEFIDDYLTPFNIPMSQVVCMPALDDQSKFHESTAFVLEMAKKYGFTGLTRLHVSAWDKTTGV
jgi:organic radical activating enzyme